MATPFKIKELWLAPHSEDREALLRGKLLCFSIFAELADHAGHHARSDGLTAFTDGEAITVGHRDWLLQRDFQLNAIAGHRHVDTVQHIRATGHVGGSEEELRSVAVKEWRMPASFFLLQHVHLGLEFAMRGQSSRLRQNLALGDFVVSCLTKQLIMIRKQLAQATLELIQAGEYHVEGLATLSGHQPLFVGQDLSWRSTLAPPAPGQVLAYTSRLLNSG